ncbi:MAG: acetate--CoA ligase family protein, partial [Methanobrevibacter sp.]|nr:acetate--CoA ligase family protein [Methanobrevibacter sp.]
MKFFEHIGKEIFKEEGISILEGHVAYTAEEAVDIASDMEKPVVLKSQVKVGGRGKAGGIKFPKNSGEVFH